MHGTELTVALLAAVTLAAGAAVRVVARRAGFPYTVAMLVLGLAVGVVLERLGADGAPGLLAETLRAGTTITPDLILLLFLPMLLFESAFGLDVHAFRRDAGPVALLALPALLMSAFLVAGVMRVATHHGLGLDWSWTTSLLFGALISATDPVAVVAVLRSVGAPRRLAVLIEGESLFNDGTAIVLFTVLLGLATGAAEPSVAQIGGSFLWVVLGGLLVGAALAGAAAAWIGRTFNDPMVEITLTLVLAYAAMVLGEAVLHVSGVIAVVVAGLLMSGPGRTRISPEVMQFLHRFWEMLAYVANTLIFFLVGLVIASHVEGAGLLDLAGVVVAYVAAMVVRSAVTFGLRPLMGIVGDPVSTREAAVMSWGGLRGAVSLALALIVSVDPDLPAGVGQQILFITAGVVLLTILLNGTTTGWLLRRLGFDHVPHSERVANLTAEGAALEDVGEELDVIAVHMRSLPFHDVQRELTARRAELDERLARSREALSSDPTEEQAGWLRRALAIERQTYWDAFERGTLGAAATRTLDTEVQRQLDRHAAGDHSPPPTRIPPRGPWRQKLRRLVGSLRGLDFDRLALRYDLLRAQDMAAGRVLRVLGRDPAVPEVVARTYAGYRAAARRGLEDLREHLPEVTRAIEERLARRIALNLEREAIASKARRGLLDPRSARAALASVQQRMKALHRARTRAEVPSVVELCRHSPLLSSLSEAALAKLSDKARELVIHSGEILFEEGEPGASMYLIARGAVQVVRRVGDREIIVDILGAGDVVGEMALLSGEPRRATIVALTPTTLGEIGRADLDALTEASPGLRERLVSAFERRAFDNHVRDLERFKHTSHDDRVRWFDRGRRVALEPGGEHARDPGDRYAFVVSGRVELAGEALEAPALGELGDEGLRSDAGASVVLLPPLGAA